MTTFKIPEGKVVDRIELDAGEGKATINIIYKEDRTAKPRSPLILVEAGLEDAWICLDKETGKLTHLTLPITQKDLEWCVPMRQAEACEFVVVPDKEVREIIDRLNNRLDVLRCNLQGKSHNLSTLAAIQGVYDCCGQLEYSITEQGK